MSTPTAPRRTRPHVNPLAFTSEMTFGGFDDTKPLILDIGAYRGEFTQQLLERFGTDYNYLVTEVRPPFTRYLNELFAKQEHVAVLGGNSSRNIRGLLEPSVQKGARIAYIFINFPDPWFKAKHHKRRVLTERFLEDLYPLLDTDSQLIFQTDQQVLFDQTIELIENDGRFTVEYFDQSLWGIQSHWEVQKVGEGSSIYRACVCKL